MLNECPSKTLVKYNHYQKTLFSDAQLSFLMLQINSATSSLLHPMAFNNFYLMRTKQMGCTSDSFCTVEFKIVEHDNRFHKSFKYLLTHFIMTFNEH